MFKIGIFLSITYFIVIPIIPDKNDKNIVTPIKIPLLAFSLVFKIVPITHPSDNPAIEPTTASKEINQILEL